MANLLDPWLWYGVFIARFHGQSDARFYRNFNRGEGEEGLRNTVTVGSDRKKRETRTPSVDCLTWERPSQCASFSGLSSDVTM